MRHVRWIKPDDEAVDAAMKIYSTSFPSNETRPVAETLAMANGDAYRLYVLEDDNGVAGMALVYVWRGYALLDYMAIEESRRHAGLGKVLFREVVKQMVNRVLLLEIELPVTSENAKARERFYKALGASTISGTYVMPSYEGMEPEAMLLMGVVRVRDAGVISKDEMRSTIRQIYADVYGRNNDDYVAISLSGMTETVRLNLVT